MTATAPVRTSTLTATGEALRRSLDGPFHSVKQRWREEVTAEDFVRDPDWDIPTAREWALDKLLALSLDLVGRAWGIGTALIAPIRRQR